MLLRGLGGLGRLAQEARCRRAPRFTPPVYVPASVDAAIPQVSREIRDVLAMEKTSPERQDELLHETQKRAGRTET